MPSTFSPRRAPNLVLGGILFALNFAVGACASPALEGEPLLAGDIAVGAGLSAGPRVGFMAGLSQRIYRGEDFDLHIELELHRQDLDAVTIDGERFDGNWDQVRGGFKWVLPAHGNRAWTGRFGVTWVRPVGDPVFVDTPEDFGGFYLGIGQDRRIAQRWLFSPDLSLIGLFEESSGESGLGLQLSLRFFWLP